MTELEADETVRAARLLEAQDKAEQLFAAIEVHGCIAPGRTEVEASNAIRDLAADLFGISRFWHKRIVRAGENTLLPYRHNPPNRIIGDDDILFCDFGPLFEVWEADFGRTFVLGDDPAKLALRDTLPRVWAAGQEYFRSEPDITGEQLFARIRELALETGYEFGNRHAGHLVGEFPHEKINGDEIEYYITPGSTEPMRRLDRSGRLCHWILEVHLVDAGRRFGGFHEELLDLPA